MIPVGTYDRDWYAPDFTAKGSDSDTLTKFSLKYHFNDDVMAYVTRSDDLHGQIDLSVRAAAPGFGHTMMFYGLGNHGGGPTITMLQRAEHMARVPTLESLSDPCGQSIDWSSVATVTRLSAAF